jgi:hypothetical protein
MWSMTTLEIVSKHIPFFFKGNDAHVSETQIIKLNFFVILSTFVLPLILCLLTCLSRSEFSSVFYTAGL